MIDKEENVEKYCNIKLIEEDINNKKIFMYLRLILMKMVMKYQIKIVAPNF